MTYDSITAIAWYNTEDRDSVVKNIWYFLLLYWRFSLCLLSLCLSLRHHDTCQMSQYSGSQRSPTWRDVICHKLCHVTPKWLRTPLATLVLSLRSGLYFFCERDFQIYKFYKYNFFYPFHFHCGPCCLEKIINSCLKCSGGAFTWKWDGYRATEGRNESVMNN